jgi:crossover junction endodeoxyribonuclease RuvC
MYLGIDQSLNATGLCRLHAQGQVEHGETVDPGKRREAARLAYVKSRVAPLLGPAVLFVAFEGYSYNSVGRVFELGEVGGVLRLLVFEHEVAYVVVPPVSLKKFATGNVSAEKEDMVAAAKYAGFVTDDDNQADAFFLAQIARCFHLELAPPNRAQLEVLHSLRSPKLKKPARRIRRLVKNSL